MRFFLPALNCFIPHGLHSFSIVIGYRQSICIGYGYGTTELLSVIFLPLFPRLLTCYLFVI